MSDDKTQNIIIDLDNIRARKNSVKDDVINHFYLDDYYNTIKEHIKIRIDESKESKRRKDFFDSRMHDSILIYGTRGNGKTTIMINLKDMISEKFTEDNDEDNIMVLDVIDPTILEPTEDFLLIVLSTIMKAVEEYHKSSTLMGVEEHHRERFYAELEEILYKIESTQTSDGKGEVFDKFYGDKTAVGLAKSLHDFFYNVTKIFKVDVIIAPIDDIDMNMKQGYNIAETIRKYLSSPYIIPVVSFNIKQMRAVVKYNKYKAFEIDLTDKELEHHKDLDFLYSIPTDYLASIFPPDRRIVLKSIYDTMKEHNNNKDKKLYFHLSKLHENENKKSNSRIVSNITNSIPSENIIALITSIIFERDSSANAKKIFISEYLTDRSTRDFFKDCHAVMNAMTEKGDEKYLINYETIRKRFSPDDKGLLTKHEQALSYLWDEFVLLAQKNLSTKYTGNSTVKNNWPKILTEILYGNQTDEVNKKLYRRLWLQQYYIKQKQTEISNIFLHKDNKEKLSIRKQYKLTGAIELAMRSYIPMYLFETIIKNSNTTYSSFDLIALKELAEKDLIDVAYQLSTFEILLNTKNKDKSNPENYKVFGSVVVSDKKNELYEAEYNIPYLFKLRNQEQLFDEAHYISQPIYFFSVFKAFALFIEIVNLEEKLEADNITEEKFTKEVTEDFLNDFENLLEEYRINLPCFNDDDFVEKYKNGLIYGKKLNDENIDKDKVDNLKEILKDIIKPFLDIELNESSFGILEIVNFSQRVVEYFFEVRANTNLGYSFSEVNLKKHTWFCKEPKTLTQRSESKREKICFVCDKSIEGQKYKNFKKDKCLSFSEEENSFTYKVQKEEDINELIKEYSFVHEEVGTLSEYFDYPLSAYLSSFSQALLISLAESSKGKKDKNIYTRNSFHGANIMILKRYGDNKLIKLSQKSSFFFDNIKILENNTSEESNYKAIYTYFNEMMNFPLFNKLFENYSIFDDFKEGEYPEDCRFLPKDLLNNKKK